MSWLKRITNLIPTVHSQEARRPYITDEESDIIAQKNIEIEELTNKVAWLRSDLEVAQVLFHKATQFDAGDGSSIGEGTQIALERGLWYVKRPKPGSYIRPNGMFDLFREDTMAFPTAQAALRFFKAKNAGKEGNHA